MESLKWIGIYCGLLLLGALLVFAACPRLLTGPYADITIDSISIDSNGQYTMNVKETRMPGVTVSEETYEGTRFVGGGSGGSSGFMGWPSRGNSLDTFLLDIETLKEGRPRGPRPERLLVKPGEIHRLRPGEKLCIFDFVAADGVRHSQYISVDRWQSNSGFRSSRAGLIKKTGP